MSSTTKTQHTNAHPQGGDDVEDVANSFGWLSSREINNQCVEGCHPSFVTVFETGLMN